MLILEWSRTAGEVCYMNLLVGMGTMMSSLKSKHEFESEFLS